MPMQTSANPIWRGPIGHSSELAFSHLKLCPAYTARCFQRFLPDKQDMLLPHEVLSSMLSVSKAFETNLLNSEAELERF